MSNLEKVLIDSIEKFNGALDKGVDFALEQAPDVVEQLLVWNFNKSLIFFVISAVVFLITVFFISYSVRGILKDKKPKDGGNTIYFEYNYSSRFPTLYTCLIIPMIAFLGLVVTFCIMVENLDWLQIWLAPKLYLLEYAAGLMK